MPVEIHFNTEFGFVFTQPVGDITADDIEAYQERLRSDPRFRPDMAQLVDLRRARLLPSYAECHVLSKSAPFSKGARRAILVPDLMHHGVVRQWSALGGEDRGEMQPFTSFEDACDWIGVPSIAIPEAGRPSET